MQSLGNDFIIIDSRDLAEPIQIEDIIPQLCDRNLGIGCDQLIIIRLSDRADCRMEIFNADGSKSNACGNATRCVAAFSGKPTLTIEVADRILVAENLADGQVRVEMGAYTLKAEEIPISNAITAPELELFGYDGFAISVGNPHFVIFTDNILTFPLSEIGPKIENHYLFPQKTNVSIVQIIDNHNILMRTWERGCGETKACGTAACATSVISHLFHGLSDKITAKMAHGELKIELQNHDVFLTGDAHSVFFGFFDPISFHTHTK